MATAVVAGHDAVIDTIGATTPHRRDITLESDVAASLITHMQKQGVRRLLATSSLSVGDSLASSSLLPRILVRSYQRGSTQDKAAMEQQIVANGLDWTIARPAVPTDGSRTGRAHLADASTGERAQQIFRTDLADWLVAQVDDPTYLHQTVTLATR